MTSDAIPPIGQEQKKPLGIFATLLWAVLAFLVAQGVGTLIVLVGFSEHVPSLESIRYDAPLVALVTLITNPVIIVLLAIVARLAGWNWAEYLALTPFRAADFVRGLIAIAVLVVVIDACSWLADIDLVSKFQTDAFGSARSGGWLVALSLAVIVIGPAGEEVLFRGFLFRGLVRDGWPGVAALIGITALWTALHVQYDWFGIMQVFLIGLVLGWIRWRSGSTTLALVLHMLVNFESTIETMLKVGMSG